MSVAVRSVASDGALTGADLLISLPAGTVNGDLLIAVIQADGDGSIASITAPAGWTTVGSHSGATTTDSNSDTGRIGYAKVFAKVASGEPGSYTFGLHSNASGAGVLYSLTGATQTPSAVGVTYTSTSASSTTHVAPSVTGAAGGMLLAAFMSGAVNGSALKTWTTPTGMTAPAGSTVSVADWAGEAVTYQALASGAATGTRTSTCNVSIPWMAASIVVPSGALSASATVTDDSTFTDAATVSGNIAASKAETATFTDAVVASRVFIAAQADTSTLTDAVRADKGTIRGETANFGSAVATTATSSRALAEVPNFTDSAQVKLIHADIDDYQFVIPIEPWVPWGAGQTIAGKFTPGGYDLRTQDTPGAVGDYMLFGTDRKTPPTWGWDLFTDVHEPGEALKWSELLACVWDNGVRLTPGGVLPLRYKVAGRVRRVYGRPGKLTAVPDQVQNGKVHLTADFRLAEDAYYDDDESTATVKLTPGVPTGTGAGIVLNPGTTLPWVFTTPAPPQTGQVIIGGSRETWVDIEFRGPSANPFVQIGSLTWGLTGVIPLGQTVTLTGRPWEMGVRRSDGVHLPGMLDPRARLSALALKPGTYAVTYGAVDASGTSQATLRWHNANKTL